MKPFLVVLLVFLISLTLSSQEIIKARTNPGYVNITKDPPKPPYLDIVPWSLSFIDQDGNFTINANENSKIQFQLKNSGQGPGLNLEARVTEKNLVPGISFSQLEKIGNLQPGNSKTVELQVSANLNTIDTKASFSISINEANGFGIDPVIIEVPVRAFINPLVKIVDYKITSQSGFRIEKRKPFDVQVLVQNIGQGRADNVIIAVSVPENMFCLTDNTPFEINNLAPGEQKLLGYTFVTNNNYPANDIRLNFQVKELYNKYSENKNILIEMNQQVTTERLIIQGKPENASEFEIGSITSMVDKNIPINSQKNPNKVAIIIGNEDYSGNLNAEINVEYAVNDATIFKQYAINTLGVPENNVFFSVNATAGEMRRNIDLVSKLVEKMGPQSELIFYYAGHGLPDEVTKIPYLIPVDVGAGNLEAAIKLIDVYFKFGNSKASRVTLFLDACFSGGGRNQGLLSARGVRITPREEAITGNLVIFSASSGEQSALPLKREKHGLFTYFLLKSLQESSGNETYEQLAGYIRKNVSIEALRENGKEQDPVVIVSSILTEKWKTFNLLK